MQKTWSAIASTGLSQTLNPATTRQNIIDWVDNNGGGWALNSVQSRSFPDRPAARVLVTATKTAANKVSIDRVEPGF